jgi:hypothetical protein
VQDESSNGVASVTLFTAITPRSIPACSPARTCSTMARKWRGCGRLVRRGLAAFANRTVIEFYVQATDTTGRVRTWPAAAWDTNNTFAQLANAYYQVDDDVIGNTLPAIRLVMSATEHAIYAGINQNSDAEQNVTMVSTDGDGTKIRHLSGMRIRGAGSRSRNPKNNRVNIPNDNLWNGMSAINLNAFYVHAQLAGAAAARKAGLPASDAHVVYYRTNGVSPSPITAPVNGNGNQGAGYGAYLLVQPVNGDLAEDLFPGRGRQCLSRLNRQSQRRPFLSRS